MALLEDILRWTEAKLTPWQRDAARRLFQKPERLSDQDYSELYSMLKAAHGVAASETYTPEPLAAVHLPSLGTIGAPVVLKALRQLKNVNRIPQDQKLVFSSAGLTVVYGGNGSGKSGYSRVLKRACRARDQVEQVLPDATDRSALRRTPEATFDLETGGSAKTAKWSAEVPAPDELSTIAVFDSHCARVYLTDEQEVAYLPYGLDVMENLANKVLPELQRRLDGEIAGISVDLQPFSHLFSETAVGRLIAGLSDRTNPASLRQLGQLSDEETHRSGILGKSLAEADPAAKAKEFQRSALRLKHLGERVEKPLAWVGDKAIERLKLLSDAHRTAKEAERIAAEALRSKEVLLAGTGEGAWKELFDAAQRFSTEAAYPEHEFPHVSADARCVLCQQQLKDGASRMERFAAFLKNDTAKIAAQKKKELDTALGKIESASLSAGIDDALTDEISSIDETVPQTIVEFETVIEARRTWMLQAVAENSWSDILPLPESPRRRLRKLAAESLLASRSHMRAADQTKRAQLQKEHNELRYRGMLKICLEPVLALVERMKQKARLESCKKDLKTKHISDKSKDLASTAVTAALKASLDREFAALEIEHVRTKLVERTVKGKTKYRLTLDLPTAFRLDQILSEGEQRAIALGSFLAELNLTNHTGGIVFDDPVSSLDHHRRQRVAKRLVQEASKRQVIVLTHDTSFLGELRDEIEQHGTAHTLQYLEWVGDRPGFVSPGLPWGHQSYKERIDVLKKTQQRLQKAWPAYPSTQDEAAMRNAYGLLRATIERVIQDVVFCGVVRRYRDWVRVDQLARVVGFQKSEHDEISRIHQRCNDAISSHDRSSGKNAPCPSAADLGQDIADLEAVIATIQARKKNITTSPSTTP